MTKRELRKAVNNNEILQIYAIQLSDNQERSNDISVNGIENDLKTIDAEVRKLLNEFPEVYPVELKLLRPPKPRHKLSLPSMRIDTGDAEPINIPYYRMSPEDLSELKKQLSELLEAGLIKPSISPWGAPCLFVKKQNGQKRLVERSCTHSS
jgi:hypothetical protein